MPEGDTIHNAAKRIRGALLGKDIQSIETPHPRHGKDRWPERLAGQALRSVDAHGKHLFLRFDNDLTLHSHLRMTGWWGVYPRGRRWGRAPRRAWLVIRTPEHEVVQFDGPVLELMNDSRTRFDQRVAGLGRDILAEEFDEQKFLTRLREDDQKRGIGDALLDQRNVAGIGNLWKSEGCFIASVSPWRRVEETTQDDAMGIVEAIRPLMQRAAEEGGPQRTFDQAGYWESPTWVYNRPGQKCRRCVGEIRARGQGEDNRTTYWCPECQR